MPTRPHVSQLPFVFNFEILFYYIYSKAPALVALRCSSELRVATQSLIAGMRAVLYSGSVGQLQPAEGLSHS
jgi:hypothetical protein